MYEVPSPEEIKKFMVENNLTGVDMAALSGVKPRAARRWVAPADQKGAAPIPWAAWALIQILVGKVSKNEYLKKISAWKTESLGRKLFERGVAGRPPKLEGKDENQNVKNKQG
jgi:hypothetical protein